MPAQVEPGTSRLAADAQVALEERVDARLTLGTHGLDNLLERDALVGVDIERHVANCPSSSRKLGVAGEANAERERVGDESHDGLELDAGAVGRRAADEDVVLSGDPVEDGRVLRAARPSMYGVTRLLAA